MATRTAPRDTIEVPAREAGMGVISLSGIIAGFLVALSSFAILTALAGAIARAAGFDNTNMGTNAWTQTGIVGGVVVALLMLGSWLFGGYISGRMAGRAGVLNGFLAFLVGIAVAISVGLVVNAVAGTEAIVSNLRGLGVPTGSEDLRAVGTFTGVGLLLAMLAGALMGGALGTRWHREVGRRLTPAVMARTATRRDAKERRRTDRDAGRETDRSEELATDGRRDERDHEMAGDGHDGRHDDNRVRVIDLRNEAEDNGDEQRTDGTDRVERYEPDVPQHR